MIDLIELETVFDDDMADYFFDPESGRIVSHLKADPFGYGDLEEDEEEMSEIERIEKEWLPLDRISSRERFEWMEEFITTVYSITAQTALRQALSQKKPFRNFRDSLMEYPDVRQQFFRFEDAKRREYAVDFIESLDWEVIEVVDTRPMRPGDEEQEIDPAEKLAPTSEEREWILRGASEIAAKGGRSQLALLLKGSKDKKLLKHGLNRSDAYGKLSILTIEEIENRVDHLIRQGQLRVEFFGDLPLIILTDGAWEEVRPWSNAQEWRRAATAPDRELSDVLLQWRNRPRSEQLHLLEAAATLDPGSALRILRAWHSGAGKEMRARIEEKMPVGPAVDLHNSATD
jgi:hypothetical protein